MRSDRHSFAMREYKEMHTKFYQTSGATWQGKIPTNNMQEGKMKSGFPVQPTNFNA